MPVFQFDVWLKKQLEKRKWTAVQLATRAGIEPSTITHAIRCKTSPTLKTLTRILDALNMHIEIVNNEE